MTDIANDSLGGPSVDAAQQRLSHAMDSLRVKLSDQHDSLTALRAENDHLKNLLETQSASIAALQKPEPQQGGASSQEVDGYQATIKELRDQKQAIKARLDAAIERLELITANAASVPAPIGAISPDNSDSSQQAGE